MSAEAIGSVPTPLSPSKRNRLAAMGSVIAGEAGKDKSLCATPPVSGGLVSNSDAGRGSEEFNRKLLMRRSKVDGEGTTWESPACRPRASSDQEDAGFAGRLTPCASTPIPWTPEQGLVPWPSSGRPKDEDRTSLGSPCAAASLTDGGLPCTPERKAASHQKTKFPTEEALNVKLLQVAQQTGMTQEQVDAMRALIPAPSGSGEDEETRSQASSGNDTGSSHSPPGPALRSSSSSRCKQRPTSAPPSRPAPGELYEEVPQYKDLRKRRSLGNRPEALKVRFRDDITGKIDSDDEKQITPGNICLKTRGRRVSRGPDGAPYRVGMKDDDDDDDETEDAEASRASSSGPSYTEMASAVAKGATGAFCGGATGAAVGLGGALLTFGLSVPIGAIVGSTIGGLRGYRSVLPEDRPPSEQPRRRRHSNPDPPSRRD
eukprot:TRINITY_DN49066_c0_g1_i1.p1 TRINITY_DN49066_c0_g1~~TRINITY_DN49066_c0_g1_i1.p1  ORF type:complete len:431 (+),score=79.51 TRINITY_DN49066_c0_g1_i1:62-1354(+)